jgi:hypothetical protein
MTQDKPPPRQSDLFSGPPVTGRGVKTVAKHENDAASDLDLDELVDTLIEAPEFARARQITDALGIDPDAGPGFRFEDSEAVSSTLPGGQQPPLRDVEETVQAVDFDLADLLARASDELEQRQPPPAADDAAVPGGFAVDGFDPDPAQLESFSPPPRPRDATGPRLAVVRGAVVDSKVVPITERVKKSAAAVAPTSADEPTLGLPQSLAAKRVPSSSRAEAPDGPAAGSTARPAGIEPSRQEIDELWQETSRLERRFAAAQELRDSLGRGVSAASAPAPRSPHPRFAETNRKSGSVQWRRRLVSWLAAGLVAAAIIAAGRLGVFDPARAWLHQQLGWTPSAGVEGAPTVADGNAPGR